MAHFQANWGLIDDVLYRLCRGFPDHEGVRATVSAKVVMIGRVYAAGLERLELALSQALLKPEILASLHRRRR